MAASIIRIKSALNFYVSEILLSYCRFQLLKLCHILKRPIIYLYIMILCCILVTRHQHILYKLRKYKSIKDQKLL
jgi:hypothetical protein